MKKKHLRHALRRAEAEAARLAEQARVLRADGEAIAEALAAVGFIRVTGGRTREDTMRAARAGVIVLDDVQLLREPEQVLERAEPEFESLFGNLLGRPGRIHARLRLEFETDPEVLDALGEHLAEQSGRPSALGGRIQS